MKRSATKTWENIISSRALNGTCGRRVVRTAEKREKRSTRAIPDYATRASVSLGKVPCAGITHFYLSSLLQSLFHFYVSLKLLFRAWFLCCFFVVAVAVCSMRILEMSNYQYARSNYSRYIAR